MAKIGDRIRHVIVTAVTDQDNITARLGGTGNNLSTENIDLDRVSSTATRGSLFVQP